MIIDRQVDGMSREIAFEGVSDRLHLNALLLYDRDRRYVDPCHKKYKETFFDAYDDRSDLTLISKAN
jgi:hypothetical protein